MSHTTTTTTTKHLKQNDANFANHIKGLLPQEGVNPKDYDCSSVAQFPGNQLQGQITKIFKPVIISYIIR